MDITRKQIEDEEDYKALQEIGKSFEADEHEVKLNAKTDELRVELLEIFDEHYAEKEDEVELGADETENETKPSEEEASKFECDVENCEIEEPHEHEESEEELDVPDEPEVPDVPDVPDEPEPEPEVEEKPKEKMYIARRAYSVWLGVDRQLNFVPGIPRTIPKNLNKDAKARVANAIKQKRLVLVED